MPALRPLSALSLGVVLLCCCSDAGPLCANNNSTPETEGNTIRGTVLNSVTHAPVGRALVYSQDDRFATLTDSAGHFELKVPSSEAERRSEGLIPVAGPVASPAVETSRPILLMARKPGFLSNENATVIELSLRQKEVTIYLVPGALIVGHVPLAVSDSSERVQVEIYRRQVRDGRAYWISAGTFKTWSNGEFRFSELSPGIYKLFTHELMDRDPLTSNPGGQLFGYPPVYFPGANNFAAGSTIQLSAWITFEANLSLRKREYYPVEIGVTNAPEGIPIGVAVSEGGQGGPGYSLGYNERTQKIQGLLPDGRYTIEVSTFGQTRETGTMDISVKGGAGSGYTVTLVQNRSISVNVAEEFTSAKGGGDDLQSGSLVGNRGPGGGYLTVRLEPADEFGQEGSAGSRERGEPEDGSLTLENVKPGRYWVHADSARGFAASIKCGETDLLHYPLVVPPGGSTNPIELTLRDDGAQVDGIIDNVSTIAGSSLVPASQTQPHIYLVPLPDSTGQFREVWASPDGKFSSGQIPPGDYRILAFDRPQPELEYRNEEAMGKYNSREREIRLLPGQEVHLQLHMVLGSD